MSVLNRCPFEVARKMVVRTHRISKNQSSMMHQLQWLKSRTAENEQESAQSYGWLWARQRLRMWRTNAPANHELRNQGYVFWDEARLKDLEPFSSPGRIIDYGGYPSNYKKHSECARIETEIQDVPVHKYVVGMIAAEIDGETWRESGLDYGDYEDMEMGMKMRMKTRSRKKAMSLDGENRTLIFVLK
ncbi:hypothetical protein BDV19DRAFT_384088 [Aspergillus venezuelensis]